MINTKIQLPEAWQATLKHILSEYAPGFQLWIFGSRAIGTAHSTSDLDLYVKHPDQKTPCSTISAMRKALSESNLPIFVDVFDFLSLPTYMKEDIAKTAVCLFPQENDHHSLNDT